jgi:hypothetical protein
MVELPFIFFTPTFILPRRGGGDFSLFLVLFLKIPTLLLCSVFAEMRRTFTDWQTSFLLRLNYTLYCESRKSRSSRKSRRDRRDLLILTA